MAVTICAMACSTRHVEAKDRERRFAAKLPAARRRASWSATSAASRSSRFGFVQSSIVSRWARDRRRALRQGLLARIDPLPHGQARRRRADPAGRRRPCAADPASDADDHRAGQPLLRLCGDQPHRVPPGQAAGAAPGPSGRSFGRCPRSSAKACARSPTPSFAPAWSRLPRKLPLAAARRRSSDGDEPHTRNQPEQMNR